MSKLHSSPSLIRPSYLPRNSGHIREVAFGEGRSNYIDNNSKKDLALLQRVGPPFIVATKTGTTVYVN